MRLPKVRSWINEKQQLQELSKIDEILKKENPNTLH